MGDNNESVSPYKHMTDEEAKKLANDMYKGLVFTSLHIKDSDDIGIVFMPLMFMEKKYLDEMIENPPGFIYEYISKASSVSINGAPIFFSCKMVSREDAKKVLDYYFRIAEAVDGV